MSESANSLELISNLNKVIEKRGLNKTIEILKKGQQPEKILQEEIISLIKGIVCDNFDITEKKLLFGNSRKHNRRWALSFFCYFVQLSLNCTQREVSKMISRTNACVSKYIKDVMTLSDSIVYEKELIERKIQIEKLLKEKINHILRYGEEKQ
tara:strand:+ start:532 stop:990 length:459 start_codon:yes stop_codon:yes gene_type:complete